MASREQLGLICEYGCWDYLRTAPQRLIIARTADGRYAGFVYCPQCMEETEIPAADLLNEEIRDYEN